MILHSSQDLRDQGYAAADFCSTKQAASLLGVSHRTVQLWVESGVLQAWKTAGGHRRIALASVNRLVEQRRQAIHRSHPSGQDSAQRKLLLVEDDAATLRRYELEIGSWGLPLQVLKASNGLEALIRIGEASPDLMIGELSMPGVDGFRMIRTLRADPTHGRMAIIVVSCLDPATIESIGLPRDIPVFGKPVPLAELRKAVDRTLRQAALPA